MKNFFLIVISAFFFCGFTCSQNKDQQKDSSNVKIHVGGRCKGCEAVYESPTPFENLISTDTLPDFNEPGQKLVVSGIVYKKDGTPAPGVVIYVYHTDQKGYYSTKGNETGWGKRHGYIRGWMKANENGEYKFYTLRPAPYPNGNAQAHIHVTIKEPGFNDII